MPEFPNLWEFSDTQKLREFIRWVKQLLAELVDTGTSPTGVPLFAEELREPMRAAWSEAVPEFDRLAEFVVTLPDRASHDHGLLGAQLNFKLATVHRLSGLFQRFGTKKILRLLLGAVDTLLGSILSALPGGSAASEIKDAIKDAINDERE